MVDVFAVPGPRITVGVAPATPTVLQYSIESFPDDLPPNPNGITSSAPISITPQPGQTSFTLSAELPSPSHSKLFLNGEKCRYGTDYTIDGGTLRWTGFSLDAADRFELYQV